jgi:PilZ domain
MLTPRRTQAPTLDGSDRRQHPRVLTLRTAKLSWADHEPVDCAVLDISAGGARVLVPEGAKIPDIVALEIDQREESDPPRVCKVAWRAGAKLGLQFEK